MLHYRLLAAIEYEDGRNSAKNLRFPRCPDDALLLRDV